MWNGYNFIGGCLIGVIVACVILVIMVLVGSRNNTTLDEMVGFNTHAFMAVIFVGGAVLFGATSSVVGFPYGEHGLEW